MRKTLAVLGFAVYGSLCGAPAFEDRTHESKIFSQQRHYRLFLPAEYETSGKRYPVIYYFHGHSDRYTLEHYDDGKDTAPRISAFAAKQGVIVVAVDGYVAEHYGGFYGGAPWDLMRDGGKYDFGEYFLELVSHIDSTLKTATDRRSRATSGLSMGGFMSLWLAARYPDRIGSASAFNPGPEFYVGESGRRVLWRPKDHTASLQGSKVRLVRASGDYISQYHEETRAAFAAASGVDFEFRQDEYHRHWATSIEETFRYHLGAFDTPELNNVRVSWNYASPYRSFRVWDYEVATDGADAGFTELAEVRQGGFRVTTRRWAPDGPSIASRSITVRTAPVYRAGERYALVDYRLWTGKTQRSEVTASPDGRLVIQTDGAGHQISIQGPGTTSEPPVLLPLTAKDYARVLPGRDIHLPVRVLNPRATPMEDVRVTVESEYPQVSPQTVSVDVPRIGPGEVIDVSTRISHRFTAGAGDFARVRLTAKIAFDGWHSVENEFDVMVAPEVLPTADAVEVLDGRTMTFDVFLQKGNQGGGDIIKRTVTEGKGNGNGILEPGERATVWVRVRQGMDPFDKNSWHRAKVYSDSPWLEEVEDIQEPKQREWTSAQERTSLLWLKDGTPAATSLPVILSSESWSFHFTPDVRYGKERLYQAFQLHTTHLHRADLASKK